MSTNQIQNLVGAVSFTNAVKDSISQEAEHATASIERVKVAWAQLITLNQYLVGLSRMVESHGLSGSKEAEAAALANKTAIAVATVKGPLTELVSYFEQIDAFMDEITERLNDLKEKK